MIFLREKIYTKDQKFFLPNFQKQKTQKGRNNFHQFLPSKKSLWSPFAIFTGKQLNKTVLKNSPNTCKSGKSVIADVIRTPSGKKLHVNSTKAAVKLSTFA
jgi:hypothetical protein